MSGAPRPARPGDLGDVDRAELTELAAAARRSHDWATLADRLVRLRARGVSVAALSRVVGVGESRLRVVCREHGPDPESVGDPLGEAGWVDTATAARAVLGVSLARLLKHTVRAEGDGVAVMAGWTRRWHGPSLPGWWAAQRVDPRLARPGPAGGPRGPGPRAGRWRCERRGHGRRGRGEPVERLPVPAGRSVVLGRVRTSRDGSQPSPQVLW